MHGENFFIVLPSNSSMKYFSDNTTTNFTTQLPREISLHGEWAVGLSEIHIPCSITHLQEEDCLVVWDTKYCETLCNVVDTAESSDIKIGKIPYGVYMHHLYIIREINNLAIMKNAGVKLIESPSASGYVDVDVTQPANSTAKTPKGCLVISSKIRSILGFSIPAASESFPALTTSIAIQPGTRITAQRPACINRALPDQLFVYTDICIPYTVGDVQAALLRIVNLNTANYIYGSTQVKHFSPPNYIPLINHRFRTIVLDIRDHLGKPIAFEYGTLTVTLHFKRIA